MARFRAARPVRLILPRQLSSYPPRRPFLLGILNLATMAEVAMGRKITRSASVDPPGGRQPSPVSKARLTSGRTDVRGSKPDVLPLLGCPLWVKSRHRSMFGWLLLYPRKR